MSIRPSIVLPPPPRQVRVLAIGREETIGRLRRKLPHWCVLTEGASMQEAMQSIRARRYDVVMFDPASVRFDLMMAALTTAADVGVGGLLYCVIDPQTAASIVRAVRILRCEVICIGADDESLLLGVCLRSMEHVSAPALVARELASAFLGLPSEVRAAIVGLFAGMPIPVDVSVLTIEARASQRTVERSCARQGLTTPGRLLIGARIARAWRALASGKSISEVAAANGWDSTDRFRLQFRRLLGTSPTSARRRMDTGEFCRQLATSMRSEDSGARTQ